MPFTPQEIADKKFLITMRGYDRAEVKAFLRAVAADLALLRTEVEASLDPDVVIESDGFGAFAASIETNMLVQATETTAAILEAARAEAHQIRVEARERSEEWLSWTKELAQLIVSTAQTEVVLRSGQAIERSEGMLEDVRTRSEALLTAAEASTEQVLTGAQEETSEVKAARDDLRERLAFTQNALRDLIVLASGTSVKDQPPRKARLARVRDETPREVRDETTREEVAISVPDSR